MKKTALFISLTPLLFSLPAIAQGLVMTDEELARVVCNHVEQTADTKVAIANSYRETKNIIDEVQRNILKSLASGKLDVQDYCANIQN